MRALDLRPGNRRRVDAGSNEHIVQFYESDEYLTRTIATYAADGLGSGQRAVLFVTAAHRDRVLSRLVEAGFDVDETIKAGQLDVIDADEALAAMNSGSQLDDACCLKYLEGLVVSDRVADGGVRVFGEMVNLLWRDGDVTGAIRLERIWNELAVQRSISLMCAYPIGGFYRRSHGAAFDEICGCHTRVLPAEGYSQANDDDRGREVSRLQQRARALETEVEHRRALERALREALIERRREVQEAERASRAKSDFLAVMSHELRTPLNAIIGYEDLMSEGVAGPLTSRQKLYLERIRGSARQLLNLVDQVLHLARIEARQETVTLASVDLGALVREALHLIEPGANSRNLTIAVRAPDEPMLVCTDLEKLRQILTNVLSNALKFTPQGGISVAIREEADFAAVDVSDTGIGISEADVERVFEPFVQVDASRTRVYGGSGLGLAVCRHLARVLGGDITVESRPGQGSKFTLRIPRELQPTPA